MSAFTYRTWLALAICGLTIGMVWLFVSLFQGVLVIFAGFLLSIFLNGLAERFQKYSGLKYQYAFLIVTLVLLGLAGGVLFLMGNQISNRIGEFVEQFDEARQGFLERLEGNAWWSPVVNSVQQNQDALMPNNALSTAKNAVSTVMTALGGFLLVLFLGFYFALQSDVYQRGFLLLLPKSYEDRAKEIIGRVERTMWKWILGRLVGMLIIGTCSTLGLWAIGIPLPLTMGVLAGLLTFIPNVGPIISVIPPLLFGLQQGGNAAIYVVVFYLILQFVESYFVTPLITQEQVGLPPGLVLTSQLLFGMLAGFLGLLLADPITAVLMILVQELYVKDYLGKEVEAGPE